MIASFQHKFVFVKTRKVAGTAVEIALYPHCGAGDIITPIVPVEPGHERTCIDTPRRYGAVPGFERFFRWAAERGLDTRLHDLTKRQFMAYKQHMSARKIRDRLERTQPGFWDRAFRFTIERHPYDKCLSQAAFMLRSAMPRPISQEAVLARIDEAIESGEINRWSDWKNYTCNGRICVNRILMYENLAEEFQATTRALGLPETSLPRAKSGIRHAGASAGRDTLTDRQKRAVQEVFANEFAHFDFEP